MEPAKAKEDGGTDRGEEPSSSALLSAGKVEFTLKQEIQDEEEEEEEDEDEGRPDGDDMDDDEEETEDDRPTPTTTPLPVPAAPPPAPSEPSAGKPSLKRPRASSHEYTPCVQVIYKCLTNESTSKLKELMQQWVDWHSKSVAILEDADQTTLQSGDETYYPTLQVGEHKSNAVHSGNCTSECTQSSLSREKEASFLGRVGSNQAEIPKEWPRDDGAVNNTRQLLLDKRGPAGGPRATSRYHQSASGGKSDDSKAGFVGNETRHSLGILDKDPPPWLHGVRELGYSPGYLANMGISLCGFAMNSSLSWDLNANWNQDMEKSTVPPASKGLSTFLDPRAQAVMPSPRGLTTPIRMPPSSRMPLNCLAGSSPPSRVSASENLLKRKGITARTSVQGQPSIDNNCNNTPGKGTDFDMPHAPPASQGAHSEAGGEMGDDVARSGADQQEGNKNASFDNWDPLETTVLVAAKLRLEELIESKKLPNDVKSKNQRWDYISEVCAKSEVRRTGTQCMNRWNRVLKEWKAIYNYEQNIPPGQHSYWSMMIRERKSAKLPGTFDCDLYKAIESRYGRSRGNLRGNMLMDSAGDMLGSDATDSVHAREEHMELDVDGIARAHAFENASSDEADLVTNVTCRHDYYRNAKESSNGYKRFKLEGAPLVKEDLEESFRKLVDIFQKVEEERNEWQRELVDIRRSEFEANVQLQKEKLENERQNNMALFQIANAIHFLSNNFGNNSSNNTVQQ